MIITLTRAFIEELNKKYSYKGYTQVLDEKHFYISSILINSTPFIACVPLHSYCRANFIPITPPNKSSHWKNHGLEYGKTLLLKPNDLQKHAALSGIDAIVWNDIVLKQELITKTVKTYFIEISNSMEKKNKGLYLSYLEQRNLNHSTLNCFPEYMNELSNRDISQLDFKFVPCSSITELVNKINSSVRASDIKEIQTKMRKEIEDIIETKNLETCVITDVKVFGSYLEQKETPSSNIDILVEYSGTIEEDTLLNEINSSEEHVFNNRKLDFKCLKIDTLNNNQEVEELVNTTPTSGLLF